MAVDYLGNQYFYLPCGSIPATYCGGKSGVGLCQVDVNNAAWSYGQDSTADINLLEWNKRVIGESIRFSEGDDGRSSSIDFMCDPAAGLGHLTFDIEEEQVARFVWHTEFVCTNSTPVPMPDCIDPISGDSLRSLSSVWRQFNGNKPASVGGSAGETYYYLPCGSLPASYCGGDVGAAVCQVSSYADPLNCGFDSTAQFEVLRHDGHLISEAVFFSGGTNNRTSAILFVCDETAGLGSLQLLTVSVNHFTFQWNSLYVCKTFPE